MADSSLQSLLSTKAALDLGLITQADFDAVKGSFLRAQQIKAAVDVGLIKQDDYEETKQNFLGSLLAAGNGGAPVAAAAALPPAAAVRPPLPAAAPAARPPVHPQQPAAPAAVPPPPARAAPPPPAAAQQPQQQQAPQPPPPQQQQAPPPAAPPPAALQKVASNLDVPSNIPKMGGIKAMGTQGTSMSGIAVTEDAVNLFYLMRMKATYKWALWQVDDSGTAVIIAAVGDKWSTYDDFLAALPDADCRYGVYDFEFETPDGQKLHKMLFLNWAPDSARVRTKMMYASTKDFFKSHLDGLSLEFQASDLDDVSEQEVGDAVRALKRG